MARSRASWWDDRMADTASPSVREPVGGNEPRPALLAEGAAALPQAESSPARSGPGAGKSAPVCGQHAHAIVPHTGRMAQPASLAGLGEGPDPLSRTALRWPNRGEQVTRLWATLLRLRSGRGRPGSLPRSGGPLLVREPDSRQP